MTRRNDTTADARRASDPRQADKAPQSPASYDLGQEKAESNIKPNTTDAGNPPDRGP